MVPGDRAAEGNAGDDPRRESSGRRCGKEGGSWSVGDKLSIIRNSKEKLKGHREEDIVEERDARLTAAGPVGPDWVPSRP